MSRTSLPHVIVSVLNWNAAETTLACLKSVIGQSTMGMTIELVVVDNGSEPDDWQTLQAGLPAEVRTVRLDRNTGFAAGHNVVMREALARQADFIWLLNNDTIVAPDTLTKLVSQMEVDPRCGSISPLIYALHDCKVVDFWGAWHDWETLRSRQAKSLEASRQLQADDARVAWNYGTAVLFRVAAIRQIGLLKEEYFAYLEDDDIGIRLARAGWANRVCFEARIQHRRATSEHFDRPPYYFYLITRNSFGFWNEHTLNPFRRSLDRRLLCDALMTAASLRSKGLHNSANACLLGALHGLLRQFGPPNLEPHPPAWIRLASRLPFRILKKLSA